ncbi:lipid-A-disaccharide synthase [Limnobacter sp.]|jgi:lipid-A-disaccharide synthase|uniref:lipid-A-disaccharide synthase n=2 Tax=Limnobacter sp. TaxID=2003368 RepID=UPI0039C8CD51
MAYTRTPYSTQPVDLAIAVGEASGDWIGALAIEHLIQTQTLAMEGIAGPKLRDLGVKPLHGSEELSVRGYVEVLRHLPRLLKMRKNLIQHWSINNRPKVFVGVDAPDFNLNLELALRESGVPTVHVVCPSIWAWRMERIHKIKAACSHVLCIFPFEPEILAKEGISATYIGHPMAALVPETINPMAYRAALGLQREGQLLAVLPGSRGAEVKHIGPVFVQACVELLKQKPDLRFVTPMPPASKLLDMFRTMIPAQLLDRWALIEGKSHECMASADAVMLASGTATLEAMMYRKPMVIAYKMPWLSYQMMKGKGYQPYVGLPNILLNEFAVPELLQDDATPAALAQKALFQLDNDANRDRLQTLFAEQHQRLLKPSGEIASRVIQQVMNG